MLKRLFISLIILSALTSDASAFSAYMLSTGFCPECWLNNINESRIVPERAGGSLYISPAEEIIQSHTMQCRLVSALPDTDYASINTSVYYESKHENKQTQSPDITFCSDPSPPYC